MQPAQQPARRAERYGVAHRIGHERNAGHGPNARTRSNNDLLAYDPATPLLLAALLLVAAGVLQNSTTGIR